MSRKGKHTPSAYRSLIREAKSPEDDGGRSINAIIGDARRLDDPYYAALALFSLASDARLKEKEGFETAKESLRSIDRVQRQWRKAELIVAIVKKVRGWRKDTAGEDIEPDRDHLYDRIVDIILSMPAGKGPSQAITGSVKSIPHRYLPRLLNKAIANEGFVRDDVKAVLKAWGTDTGKKGSSEILPLKDIMVMLNNVDAPALRSKLLGYLHLQIRKNGIESPVSVLTEALGIALSIGDEKKRFESLRYLASITEDRTELEALRAGADTFHDPAEKCRLLGTLGGRADRSGSRDLARDWFLEGASAASDVADPFQRAAIRLNLSEGLQRSGYEDMGREIFGKALIDCDLIPSGDSEMQLRGKIDRTAKGLGIELESGSAHSPPPEIVNISPPHEENGQGGGHVLALYNTYEGGLNPIHTRAVARAAPLCYAYGLDLTLLGFPSKSIEELVAEVIKETNIGKGGKHLKELAHAGRLYLREPGSGLEDIGLAVATTSRPDPDKQFSFEKLLEIGRKDDKRLCLVMGLGRHGLPASFLKMAEYHLELTGKGISLETCTVMGIIAVTLSHQPQ